MKPITREYNKRTYMVNIALALVFLLIYFWRKGAVFLIVALVLAALALWRKYVLDKVL